MKFKIAADSSANIFKMKGIEFEAVPLHVLVGKKDFTDDKNVDLDEMQEALSEYKGKTSTSCPSPEEWQSAFGDADVVFCVTITSVLSGANASANTAKEMYESEYPGRRVYIFDSLSTGPEMILIIEKIKELVLAGEDSESINSKVLDYMKHTHLYFSLASVENFAKNGRINPILAKGVGLLGIRLVGQASDEGNLELLNKCRGDKKSIECIIRHMKDCGYKNGKVIIAHNRNKEGAAALKDAIIKEFATEDIRINRTKALCSYYAEPKSILVGFEA